MGTPKGILILWTTQTMAGWQDERNNNRSTRSSRKRTWSTYWNESIQTDGFVKFQLLLLTLSTGIQDAVSFPDFRCFASNQTGNTVLFAVAVAGANNGLFDVVNTSLSLVAFITGCFLAGQLGTHIGQRRRYWQFTSQIMQTWLVFSAAWIQLVHAHAEHDYGGYLVLMLLAVASGIQVGTARAMEVPEITTAMATAAWVDLMIDPQIFAMRNLSRNRRVLFLLALIGGSFAGAFLRKEYGSAVAVFVSGGVKVVATVAILLSEAALTGGGLKSSDDAEEGIEDIKTLGCPQTNEYDRVIWYSCQSGCMGRAGLCKDRHHVDHTPSHH